MIVALRYLLYTFIVVILLYPFKFASSQVCGSNTPTFTADLRGNKDSVWTSPSVKRQDTCCGASSPDVCVEFEVTLDPKAYGVQLDIISGALPPGALYYRIDCGPKIPVGEKICLDSSGPHTLTFCKPGNNANQYQIKSITPPSASGDIVLSEACQGTLAASGFEDTSITWRSVNNNSFHNSFLSCTEDCDTTYVQAKSGYPNYVDYVVCGNPEGSCGNITECDTVRVDFVSDLNVDIQPDSPAVCYGSATAEIEAVVSGGKPPYQYTWNTEQSSSKINVGLGNYLVEVTDSTVCPASKDSVFVDSFSYPITANAGQDTTLCGNFSGVDLNGSIKAASGGIWQGGKGSFQPSDSALSTTYYPTAGEMGNDSLSLNLITTGNKTCEPDTDRVKLYFANQPAPQIKGPEPVCYQKTAIYTADGSQGNQYTWKVNGGTLGKVIANDSIRVSWDQQTGTGTIEMRAVNQAGCDTNISKKIKVNPLPDSIITGPDSVCILRDSTFKTVDSPNYQYQWSLDKGTIQSGSGSAVISANWPSAGTDELSLEVKTAAGCKSQTQREITTLPTPNLSLNGDQSVCAFTIHQYKLDKPTYPSYTWQVQGGNIVSGQGTQKVNVQWEKPGNASLSVKANNQYGCDTSLTYSVTINKAPQFDIKGPETICALARKVEYRTAYNSENAYNWQITGGKIVNSLDSNIIRVNWGRADTGILTLEVFNTNTGCSKRETLKINKKPQPAPALNGPEVVCANDQEIYYEVKINPNHNYFWQVKNGQILSGSGTHKVKVKWGPMDTGRIEVYVVNTLSQCDTSVAKQVAVFEATAISPEDTAGCEDFTVNFEGQSNTSEASFYWDFDNGVLSNQQNPKVTFEKPGSYTARLRTETPKGCQDTATTKVTVNPSPEANFKVDYPAGKDFIMAEKDSLVLDNLSQGATFHEWNFGDSSTSLKEEPVHAYEDYGNYLITLAVENEYTCQDTATESVLVKVPSRIFVPNAFSPDDNGINDFFRVSTYNISEFEILIFNRWGEIIFRSKNKDFNWDGRFKGEKVPNEMYHYLVVAEDKNGEKLKKTGKVAVLR